MTSAYQLAQKIFPKRDPDQLPESLIQACRLALEADALPNRRIISSIEAINALLPLNLDDNTLIATLISDLNLEPFYPVEKLEASFGSNIAKLVEGIRRLNNFKEFDPTTHSDQVQTERLRQMLLAMTSDIRIMVVKLGYRVARLRHLKYEDETTRRQIAEETQLIFAPLANRLGMAQLKWELEDLSFRFLEPETYKSIAHQLADKRTERESYIRSFTAQLQSILIDEGIYAEVSGRPKHIYSIWKKMSKKKLTMDELYDLRAVRVYVKQVSECYRVLSLVHSQWNFIRSEYDDYVTTPKENGYQSIHTVVIGPQGKTVEIQIRTYEMHDHAEHGIAAHWKYKEGGKGYDANLEASISNMRQLLENRTDSEVFNEISTELQSKNIYVLTPKNQIITLPQGATALDFAYAIHSDLGHSCRGAKLNGRIISLTKALDTGDRIEILAIKNGEPNRNWLNPNLGYLKTSRARTRIKHWFNKRDRHLNIESGEQLYQREIKRLHVQDLKAKDVAKYFFYDQEKDFFEALGKGQLNERQLISALQKIIQPKRTKPTLKAPAPELTIQLAEDQAYVVGAPLLKTHLAPCCCPKPDDQIIGFVTRGRGVTVHTSDCANILNLSNPDRQRLIEVKWGKTNEPVTELYLMTMHILAFDRKGLLRDIMSKLTDLDVNLVRSNTVTQRQDRTVEMELDLEVSSQTDLSALLDQIEALPNVEEVSLEQAKDDS
ncbi:bifunctional (p)ppGpp synthetase/guanosine-3',5'-bis(diphosphate) 3'-pyrophosphohydrolase [Thiomicrospira microaerophila]|uniref:RelA/SpoT family protein n=1 Tax=Thiomicrospira microaerophila TaxID=406020 RepID=UPI00200FBD22|nr:bifunctional (p)ppGpp synthetase/guanosine-3',5'-bis(diphosphate) 3'-pyrophosphohydrolase [Thiomicrospira microaerophila]UQB43341.1 bifunctional (p)ppGpp synthetase/guanosine-3',5'-bis(diphosphate) 3'-pyrophosphohydrolase [Thiomicrospira microaerophila]